MLFHCINSEHIDSKYWMTEQIKRTPVCQLERKEWKVISHCEQDPFYVVLGINSGLYSVF